jgi:CrcB protein
MKLLAITGLLGALTTFSTFSFETLELLQNSRFQLAMINVLMNVFFGLGAVLIGFEAVKRLG